jgi:hypothetical protein
LISNGFLPQSFPDLSLLTNLKTISIRQPGFTGALVDVFDPMLKLDNVLIQSTGLTGTIPQSLLTGPSDVDLSLNQFDTLFAPSSKNCTLSTFAASGNSLSGPMLNSLTGCRLAVAIDMSNNQLGPTLPAGILQLPRLFNVALQFNLLSVMELPTSPNSSAGPGNVNLSNNRFSGPMSDNFLKTLIRFGGNWYVCRFQHNPFCLFSYIIIYILVNRNFDNNTLECPRHVFYPTLATWNKTGTIGNVAYVERS